MVNPMAMAADSTRFLEKTGRAISYCINQESFLRVFLTDGAVPMTNIAAEQSIRPFTLDRKNWYLIDTIGGAKSSAIVYSIAETAKANNLKPYEYFKYLLEELPEPVFVELSLSEDFSSKIFWGCHH